MERIRDRKRERRKEGSKEGRKERKLKDRKKGKRKEQNSKQTININPITAIIALNVNNTKEVIRKYKYLMGSLVYVDWIC
jgi:hypothetical protein